MKLHEQITTKNWCQGTEYRTMPVLKPGPKPSTFGELVSRLTILEQRCLVGHVANTIASHDERRAAYLALAEAARILYPERLGLDVVVDRAVPRGICIRFNDHRDTTVEDIIRVAKVADV